MNPLDDSQAMARLDPQAMHERIYRIPAQLQEAVEIGKTTPIDLQGRSIHAIFVMGLGGSAIGGDFIRSYLSDDLQIPILVNRDYFLPACVDQHTLCVASSYSGNTEETLSAFADARRKGALVVCITSGGKLETLARAGGVTVIKIPGGSPPRAAFAYSVGALLGCLTTSGLIKDRTAEVEETMALLTALREPYRRATPAAENPAKQLAHSVGDTIPIIYAANTHFDAVATRWKGQICENAKRLAFANVYPEWNHNELVGWEHPAPALKGITVLLLRDRADYHRVQKRMEITREQIQPKVSRVLEIWSEGTGLLARMFSLVFLGDFVSYYLAILGGVDPTPVKVIDDLKIRLQMI